MWFVCFGLNSFQIGLLLMLESQYEKIGRVDLGLVAELDSAFNFHFLKTNNK